MHTQTCKKQYNAFFKQIYEYTTQIILHLAFSKHMFPYIIAHSLLSSIINPIFFFLRPATFREEGRMAQGTNIRKKKQGVTIFFLIKN